MSLLLFPLVLAMFANLQSDHFFGPALALLVQVYLAGACPWWTVDVVFVYFLDFRDKHLEMLAEDGLG